MKHLTSSPDPSSSLSPPLSEPSASAAAAPAAARDTAGPNDRTAAHLLTVEQAAAHLQLSTSSIRSYIRQGHLKAFRVAGLRKVLIPRAELLTLLEPACQSDE